MKIFDYILLDVTIIVMPLMIYLLYTAYNKTLSKEENNLIFILTIFSQIYFTIKYGHSLYKKMPLFIIDIPLLISYTKKSKPLIFTSSALILLYYYQYYSNYLIFTIIAEYIIYYLISLKINKPNTYITIFCILKTVFTIILNQKLNFEIISSSALLYIISIFVIYLLEKTEDMLKLHKSIKEIENDKQIKTSLFKITHEIKNPIAVCKGYLDMYNENKIDDFKKHVPILKEEIDRTLILLEDFLAMNKQKINKDILDINLLLEEVINNMNMLFIKNGIKLESEISEDEIYINGDYNRLTQVFINILKNSIEASEKNNNAKIKIWTQIDKENINIYVKDNGVGIPKEILNKIKEPFYTTKVKGTGLGVSLSSEIINAHKGKLKYESKEGKYTTVTVTLPLEKAI